MGHSGTSLKFTIIIDLQMFSNQIPISDLNKRDFFSNFALYSKGCHFNITRFHILKFCNIQTASWNEFWKFVLKMIAFHKVFDKNLVKINVNKSSKKKGNSIFNGP